MELPGKRKRGRPKWRFMDVVKEDMAEDGVARKEEMGRPKWRFMDVVKGDMAEVEVTEEDAEDRSNWRWKIRCGEP